MDESGSFWSILASSMLKSVGDLKITSTSTERQKHSQNLAPVLVIIFGNSLVFPRKIITSTAKLGGGASFSVKLSVGRLEPS